VESQQPMSTKSPTAKNLRALTPDPPNSARSAMDHARQNTCPSGDRMRPDTILSIQLRKTILPLPLAAVWLLASSSLMFAQSPQAKLCHMDSTGFCLADDTPNSPSSAPLAGADPAAESISAPQKKVPVAENAAIQPKLELEVRDGLLRIVAEHVSLRDVLKAISATTGAEVQFPRGALDEQVFVHLGMGTPQDLVRELLKGSHFNYVILSSNSDPGGITRLILSKKPAGSNGNSSTVPTALGEATPSLYGGAFETDANGSITPEAATGDPQSAPATPTWVHHDGPALSGEQLDQMQKAMIQQEQEQFAQQLQQQKHQQEQDQAGQNPPQQ
jgi:hypothetical protein